MQWLVAFSVVVARYFFIDFFFFLTESFFFAALSTWTKFLHFVPSDGIVCFYVFTGPDGCVDHLLLISLFFFFSYYIFEVLQPIDKCWLHCI